MKSVDSGKLAYLESVRGLAALVVVIHHIIAVYYPGAFEGPSVAPYNNDLIGGLLYGLPLGILNAGNFAVIVFFILSGFVLTYKYFNTKDPKDLHRQAAKRFVRLAVPVFATVFLAYALIISGSLRNHEVAAITHSSQSASVFSFSPSLGEAFYNASIGVFTSNGARFNPVLWTMPIELFGSFVVFGLAAFVGSLRLRWPLYVGAVVLLNSSFITCFILGMMLADIVSNTGFIDYFRTKVSKIYVYSALALVCFLASMPFPTSDMVDTIYIHLMASSTPNMDSYYLWLFLAGFLLLTVILVRPEIQAILQKKVLVWFGGLSFSIYLLHYLVLHTLGAAVFLGVRGVFGYSTSVLMVSGVTIGITLLLAIYWKKYVDDLGVVASRKFANFILK